MRDQKTYQNKPEQITTSDERTRKVQSQHFLLQSHNFGFYSIFLPFFYCRSVSEVYSLKLFEKQEASPKHESESDQSMQNIIDKLKAQGMERHRLKEEEKQKEAERRNQGMELKPPGPGE